MNPARRRAACCTFRRTEDSRGERHTICEVAGRFAGEAAREGCRVNRSVCEACCRHPLPSGPRLNPVVASLVFSAATQARQRVAPAAPAQVAIHQVRQFAARWLAGADRAGHAATQAAALSDASALSHDRYADRPVRCARFASTDQQPPRIGLVGRHSRFGLGYQNRDMAVHLGVDRWLIPRFARFRDPAPGPLPCRTDVVSRELSELELEAWLEGLDVVLFVERPVFARLIAVARHCGVHVVCVPNWEWLHPGLDWLDDVDVMLCPTRHTAALLAAWKRQFGFEWRVECVPWPVDASRFGYRCRWVCRRFVYVHGSGGVRAVRRGGGPCAQLRRKGLDVLLAAARLVPTWPSRGAKSASAPGPRGIWRWLNCSCSSPMPTPMSCCRMTWFCTSGNPCAST